MCYTGEAQVELYDGSAVISGTAYETNEEGFTEIRFQYSVGTGIETVQVQVTQNGATALDCYVGWVSVLSADRKLYDLPAVITDAALLDSFWFLREGRAIGSEDGSLLFDHFMFHPYERRRNHEGRDASGLRMAVSRRREPNKSPDRPCL